MKCFVSGHSSRLWADVGHATTAANKLPILISYNLIQWNHTLPHKRLINKHDS